TSMKAVRLHGYGGPDVLVYEEAPRPDVRPGEALVRIAAASVNPFDAKVRAGSMHAVMPLPFPAILGVDLAGTVEALGEGVALSVGDEVFGRATRGGSYAEYAA